MQSRLVMIALVTVAATAVLACSSPGAATTSPAAASLAPSVAASAAPPSEAASTEPSAPASAAAEATVEVTQLATFGPALYASKNGLTVYNFAMDVKDSGTSACTGGCSTTWPALTVAAGETPTAGDGVTGTLGTITRADDGTLQVTYNGLPLYFFKNDTKEGDANGIYQNWNAVKP